MTADAVPAGEVAARTRETLALLRRMRRSHLREQAGSAAFAAYATVIGLVVYGGALLPWLRRLSAGGQPAADAGRFAAAAPPALVALVLLALLAVLRDALWRGPVTLPVPAVSWLLPLPIDRGRLLRPRLAVQLVLGVLGGGVFGAAAAVVLAAGLGGGRLGALLGPALAGGAAAGLLAVATSALVARYPLADRLVRRLGPVATVLALALAAQAGLAAYGHAAPALVRAELWSGPWGWAVAGAVHAGGTTQQGWPVALAVLAVLALAVAVVALRACVGMPGRSLRARARSVAGLTSGLVAMDPRAAALEVRAARGAHTRAFRLPVPRSAALIIAWRDATALLRAPSRPAWTVVLTVAAGLLVALSATGSFAWSLALLAAALVAGYLAVAQLVEPARLDADDPRRATHLPYPFDRLALRHTAVPLALGGVLAEAGAVLAVALGAPARALLVPVVAVPALVAAALVSAYRGPVPSAAIVGSDTPLGNIGMLQVLGWYAAGPLVAVVLLLPPLHVVIAGHATGPTTVNYVLWGWAVAAVLLWWSRRRAAARGTASRP
jgi:hypothetical protein